MVGTAALSSERAPRYLPQYVQQLLDAGKAYIAFDTPEELEEKRKTVANFQYDATTRTSMRNSLVLPREEVDASSQVVRSMSSASSSRPM